MVDKISWLHISDLHLKRQTASWSQDVVLSALHKATKKLGRAKPVNFVLATGDLSYSGNKGEFPQVESFFNAVLKDIKLTSADLFTVPGNHDNDLSVQKYNVIGARTLLTGSGPADDLVGDGIERDQILARQAAYRDFVSRFTPAGLCKVTTDGLAYVAVKSFAPLRIMIIGLNSAWLCLSGRKDCGNVVLGERQVIDAVNAIEGSRPHLVLAMIHHPTFWLCEFEHQAVEGRLRQACDFVFRGHLHEPDVQTHVAGDHRCVFVAAGATFETRESRNSFNHIELDVGQGTCSITRFEYLPKSGEFIELAPQTIALAFRHLPKPKAADLANTIRRVAPHLSEIAEYLACLLRGDKSDFLAFDDGRSIFLSLDALEENGASGLISTTRSFMSLRNLCAFAETEAELNDTLTTYKQRLENYGELLLTLAKSHAAIGEALAKRNQEAKAYIPTEKKPAIYYTLEALRELRRSADLVTLEHLAQRNLDDPYQEVRREAVRGLALVRAHSSIQTEREKAVLSLSELCDSPESEAEDFIILSQLLIDFGRALEAKERIRVAIAKFPEKTAGFTEIGLLLVEKTGDRAFRDELLRPQAAEGAKL